MAAAGTLLILLTSLLLVRRLIRPLDRLSRATRRIGQGAAFTSAYPAPVENSTFSGNYAGFTDLVGGEVRQNFPPAYSVTENAPHQAGCRPLTSTTLCHGEI